MLVWVKKRSQLPQEALIHRFIQSLDVSNTVTRLLLQSGERSTDQLYHTLCSLPPMKRELSVSRLWPLLPLVLHRDQLCCVHLLVFLVWTSLEERLLGWKQPTSFRAVWFVVNIMWDKGVFLGCPQSAALFVFSFFVCRVSACDSSSSDTV